LNIGLVGVEAAPRPWSPGRNLLVALSTVLSLVLLGACFRLVEGGFEFPALLPVGDRVWAPPSLGFETHDSIWRSAAWLCWLQAVFQAYPLPRTMGRQSLGAMSAICGRRLGLPMQASIFRRCVSAMGLITLGLALYLMSTAAPVPLASKWPLFLLLGFLLWASARSRDIDQILDRQQTANDEHTRRDRVDAPLGLWGRIRRRFEGWQRHKKLQRAMDREHGEAVDAAKLDEILSRLHQGGVNSLGAEDRRILERVSETLRKRREDQSH
jgi:hypothetical protein